MGLNKPKIQNNKSSQEDLSVLNDRALIESILNQEYILVIGSEAILRLDIEGTDNTGDSQVLLYNQMLLERDLEIRKQEAWDDEQWHNFFQSEYLSKDIASKAERSISYDISEISSELKALINTRLFPFVMTTCIDRYLETLMRSIYGDSLKIVNFYDKESLDTFYNEIKERENEPFKPMSPTLFYAFGKLNTTADGCTPLPCVFSEDDAIRCISDWIRVEDNKKELFRFIDNKRIIAIGCNFNDWKFRFFWFTIRHSIKELEGKNTVAITSIYNNLQRYLNISLKPIPVHVETDSRQFMNRITNLLVPPQNDIHSVELWEEVLKSKRRNGGFIFLSYAHEDFPLVYQIFQYLTEKGYNVWLDNKNLYSGDVYEAKIERALNECAIFMPILSKQVGVDLANGNFNRFYLKKEWRAIKDRKEMNTVAVVALATCDYDVYKKYHTVKFREYWGITNDKEDITVEHLAQIKHMEVGLEKILNK